MVLILVQRDMIVSDVNDKPRMLKVDDVLIAVDVLVPGGDETQKYWSVIIPELGEDKSRNGSI